ncbi:FRAS1-related extracellular matrix protein 3-like [Penaeus vannamei]|uniref:FRAS1-related extracellular matrix protein 3-like n=1 Tax=Penaeus vannamei TaxID=6689 RepID=UPI00387F40D1
MFQQYQSNQLEHYDRFPRYSCAVHPFCIDKGITLGIATTPTPSQATTPPELMKQSDLFAEVRAHGVCGVRAGVGSMAGDRFRSLEAAGGRGGVRDDIDDRKVSYRLDEGTNETADSFRFSVEDKGGNRLEAQEFELNWSWISLEKELYEVNETDKVVLVHLRRRGFLGETSFVTMDLLNGTARPDEDLHPSFAHQVQFNPGQKEALWRLRLQDDQVYEGPESLGLRLALPVMAALEEPLEALIVIADEEDGGD